MILMELPTMEIIIQNWTKRRYERILPRPSRPRQITVRNDRKVVHMIDKNT